MQYAGGSLQSLAQVSRTINTWKIATLCFDGLVFLINRSPQMGSLQVALIHRTISIV